MKINEIQKIKTAFNIFLSIDIPLFLANIYIVASEAVLPETDIFWLKTQQANSNPLFRQVFTGG